MRSVRLCIGKGRGARQAYELLGHAGIQVPASFQDGHRLVAEVPGHEATLVLARHGDLPGLLAAGHVDIAVASSVWFLEANDPGLACVRELDFGRCRLSLLRPAARQEGSVRTICTRYIGLARKEAPQAQVIQLSGCNELALDLGIADAVLDVVETGATLAAMDLREVRVVAHIRHTIWVRRGDATSVRWIERWLPPAAANPATISR